MNEKLLIRKIQESDCNLIEKAFRNQNWDKPSSMYKKYLKFQENGVRDVLIAELSGMFAGYLTISWNSHYLDFRDAGIPEIVDLNVLKKFQRRGIATSLMNEAEARVAIRSNTVGIGYGLYDDYGPAQILYIKRGYLPDGKGIVKD